MIADYAKMFKDIEERQNELKKLSGYLTQLESQLSLIFAASPDMIIFLENDGKIIKISQAVWRILGYERKEMIGTYIWDYLHPDDIEKTKSVHSDLMENKLLYFDTDEYFINRWRKKCGEYAKLSWKFSMYDEREENTVGFATDVTRLALDNPFNFSLVHRAIELTKDGIVITDNLYSDNPIIYVNPAFCINTGYEKGELLGNNCRMLQSDDKEQVALKTLRESVKNGEGCEILIKNFTKNRDIFFNHLTISPIIDNKVVTNYIGISRDVTSLVNKGVYTWDKFAPRGFGKTESV